MLSKLTVKLKKKEGYGLNISSLLQGVLMEHIKPEYIEKLHRGGINPYTQHLSFYGESMFWIITTMSREAKENIIDPFMELNPDKIYLNHKDDYLYIEEISLENMTMEQLLEKTYFGDCDSYITLKFQTPTAFKVNGKYQFYPTVHHIFSSLVKKYDSISKDNQIMSEEIMEQIENYVAVRRYNLKSVKFHLEGVTIPSFVGYLFLKIYGPQQFINLINLLARFGEYSGVGIKTGIGMGAIEIIKKTNY